MAENEDYVDGALFSRINAGKDDKTKQCFDSKPNTHHVRSGSNVTTEECTIKPEDLDDETDGLGDETVDDNNHSTGTEDKTKFDLIDKLQWSRVNETEIEPVELKKSPSTNNSSTFYTDEIRPNENKALLDPKNGTDVVDTSRDQIDQEPKKRKEEKLWWKLVKGWTLPFIGLIIYLCDIGTDIKLAMTYKEDGKIDLFWVTAGCIVIPHLIMAVVDVSWLYLDRKGKRQSGRYILGILTLGRIVRVLTYMKHIYYTKLLPKDVRQDIEMVSVYRDDNSSDTKRTESDHNNDDLEEHTREMPAKLSDTEGQNLNDPEMAKNADADSSKILNTNNGNIDRHSIKEDVVSQGISFTTKPGFKSRSWHKDRAREEKRDCFMLDFINAFAESAPQLFVQLYLYFAYSLPLTENRVFNIVTSWASIAWTYGAYYRSNREVLKRTEDVKLVGFTFFFLSVGAP